MCLNNTILLTGSNGLLGQTLVKKLIENSHCNLIATSRGENRLSHTKGYVYESMDITDASSIRRVFDEYRPQTIIHTAAMTQLDVCEQNKNECWESNVIAVKHLLYAAEKYQSHFIHLSTDFVFDGKNPPYSENDLPNPVSYYGKSKLKAEKIVQSYPYLWSVIRTILVYGVVEDMSRSNIILWVKSSLEQNKEIKVVEDQSRMPTYVGDLAEMCIAVAEKKADGIYHVSGSERLSVLDIAKKTAEFYDLDTCLISPTSSRSLDQPAKRPPHTAFDLNKAKRNLNYKPCSFIEGLRLFDQDLKQ